MSIKEFFDAIGKAWNTLIGGIKSVLHKLFTAKNGVWIVLGLIICFFIGRTIIDYQEFANDCETGKAAHKWAKERIEKKISEDWYIEGSECVGIPIYGTNYRNVTSCRSLPYDEAELKRIENNLVSGYEDDSFLGIKCELGY